MRYSYTYEIYLQDTATAPRYIYSYEIQLRYMYLELLTNTTTENTKKYDASINSDVPVRNSRPLELHTVQLGPDPEPHKSENRIRVKIAWIRNTDLM
jgi:hypothetical protein